MVYAVNKFTQGYIPVSGCQSLPYVEGVWFVARNICTQQWYGNKTGPLSLWQVRTVTIFFTDLHSAVKLY